MTIFGQLNSERAALAFIDYLKTLGIASRFQQEQGSYLLIVEHQSDVVRAQFELEQFLSNPNLPKYHEASWQTGATHKISNSNKEKLLTKFLERAGPVTITISCIAIAIWFYTGFGMNDNIYLFNFNADAILSGEVYRLITPIFLHFPVLGTVFLHILFNLMWFWDLGGTLEKRLSSGVLLYLITVIALLSNLAEYMAFEYRHMFGGLSGVVFGLLGYLFLRGKIDSHFGVQLNPAIMTFMLIWLGLGFTGMLGAIANAAHTVGLLSGLFLAWFDVKILKLDPKRR